MASLSAVLLIWGLTGVTSLLVTPSAQSRHVVQVSLDLICSMFWLVSEMIVDVNTISEWNVLYRHTFFYVGPLE